MSATAERCLVAACAHLTMMVVRDENFPLWGGILRDVLPDCAGCGHALIPLRVAADGLAYAAPGRPRDNALSRLRYETQRYYARAAAHRFEAWQKLKHPTGGGAT